MRYIIAILFPPIIAFVYGGCGAFLLNCILCLFGYVPAMIHAFIIIAKYDRDADQARLLDAIQQQQYEAQQQYRNVTPKTRAKLNSVMEGEIVNIEKDQ